MYLLIGTQVKSSYDSEERPTAVCEFSGFVAVESKLDFLFRQKLKNT